MGFDALNEADSGVGIVVVVVVWEERTRCGLRGWCWRRGANGFVEEVDHFAVVEGVLVSGDVELRASTGVVEV